ncbi:lytic murein transglycosylase [Pseudovibrio sp. SPO723]|uniref:lytic murein transglycosylase n=1 Tax=Nesiotobacter zosterae TaxID=392721 RepID=UPI0029C12562|nr:lytic murein transglycosylase [Pseudovibrio sp. SPO723]MDX5594713.1 lytic murein transglycosylase [Pseudovibrio sp. SPO723]
MRRLIRKALIGLTLLFTVNAGSAWADAGFDRWVQGFWPEARKAGISQNLYVDVFRGMTPDPDVIRKAEDQPEFTRAIWQYLDSAVSDKRIENGQRMLDEWGGWLDQIEARYGVSRYVVVAIWGMESSYGQVLDNPKIVKHTIRSLATLAYKGGKRSRFGRTQLIAALKILQNGDVTHGDMVGSWAGAMGHTQFIPTTYLAHAVDVTGDGRRDIWNTIPDALGSTAAYLRDSGWNTGKTWGYEVKLAPGFNYTLADMKTKRTLAQWSQLGVQRVGGRAFPRPSDQAMLYLPAGAKGPAFLMLDNFRVIKRYNNANAYALAVGHLSDRLMGFGEFSSSWPRGDRPLNLQERSEVQRLLNRGGYSVGKVDGKIGPNTKRGVMAYQKSRGMTPDGYVSLDLLSRLKRDF